jgi:hypothetical protein
MLAIECTSKRPISLSSAKLLGRPLIHALLRPVAKMTRRNEFHQIIIQFMFFKPLCFWTLWLIAKNGSDIGFICAITDIVGICTFTKQADSASSSKDLPAPVSPVRTLKPCSISRLNDQQVQS